MKDDLIDRLKVVRHSRDSVNTANREKIFVQIHIDLLDEAIAALSPVLPEEVETSIKHLRLLAMQQCAGKDKDYTVLTEWRSADLIERLYCEYTFTRHERDKRQQRIEELEEELESERINNEDLANATYYKGNSVSWWHSKAGNYKNALGETWDALRTAGVHCDGKKSTADGVKELQQRIKELERAHAACMECHELDEKEMNHLRAEIKRLDAALDEALNNSDLTIREIQQKVAKARAGE